MWNAIPITSSSWKHIPTLILHLKWKYLLCKYNWVKAGDRCFTSKLLSETFVLNWWIMQATDFLDIVEESLMTGDHKINCKSNCKSHSNFTVQCKSIVSTYHHRREKPCTHSCEHSRSNNRAILLNTTGHMTHTLHSAESSISDSSARAAALKHRQRWAGNKVFYKGL